MTSLVHRWITSLAAFVLVMLAGVCLMEKMLPKLYGRTVVFDFKNEAIVNPGSSVSLDPRRSLNWDKFEDAIATMESPFLLFPIIQKHGLTQTWSQLDQQGNGEPLTLEQAFLLLRQRMRIEAVRNFDELRLTVVSENPREAAAIAKDILDDYGRSREHGPQRFSNEKLEAWTLEVDDRRKITAQTKAKLLRLKNSGSDGTGENTAAFQEYTSTQRDLQREEAFLEALEFRLREMRAAALPVPPSVDFWWSRLTPGPSSSNQPVYYSFVLLIASTLGGATLLFTSPRR